MKFRLALILLFLVILAGCGPTHTADSITDIRWEETSAESPLSPPSLSCDWVDECIGNEQYPDKVILNESERELYMWSYDYETRGSNSTAFFIVINRLTDNTWDKIGVEFIDGEWKIGVYGKVTLRLIGNTIVRDYIFDIVSAGTETGDGLAIGMAGEQWAVIVRPMDKSSFLYSIEEYYWNKKTP